MTSHRGARVTAVRGALAAGAAAGLAAFSLGAWLLPWPAAALTAVGLAGWWCWHMEQGERGNDDRSGPAGASATAAIREPSARS